MNQPPPLFSARRRLAQRARHRGGDDVIAPLITESLLDRLGMVMRQFERALLVAPDEHALTAPLQALAGSVLVNDTLPNAGALDLIVWPGGLEAIDDVPGALVRARALLRPDGLMIGALAGDGSFPLLRRLLVGEGMRAIPRLHPQIDLKTFGNLLQRTGFALPVTDVEATVLRYSSWRRLVEDLRGSGLASQLASTPPPLTRAELGALDAGFAAACDAGGRAAEELRIIYFTAWAPHPDQPRAARRGSATASLAAALRQIDPKQ